VPLFLTFHVFVKACPGVIGVLSGMVTSFTNDIILQDEVGFAIIVVAKGVMFASVAIRRGAIVLVGIGVFVGAANAV
jgi:hypothetical protein